jgi:hypothetical protein
MSTVHDDITLEFPPQCCGDECVEVEPQEGARFGVRRWLCVWCESYFERGARIDKGAEAGRSSLR